MGLLDNNKIIVSKQTKTGSATIASLATGNLISITNTDKQFRTLQITIKATLADADGDKTFSWYWSTSPLSAFPLFHTKDGYVYMTRGGSSDYGSNLSLEELHDTNLNYYNANVYERTFYVDVNGLFDDEEGNLSMEYASDGFHVWGRFYTNWADWLQKNVG